MTTYFVGGGFDCWQPSVSAVTDSARGVRIGNGSAFADAILRDASGDAVSVSSLWFHSSIGANAYNPDNGNIPLEFRDAAGVPQARLRWNSATGYILEFYNGSAWVSAAPAVVPGPFGDIVDIQIVIDPTQGRIAWYYGGTLAASLVDIDTSGMAAIRTVRAKVIETYLGSGSYLDTIVASYNTIGHVVRRRAATGAGAHSEWAGAYTDIDEDITNDADAISTSTTDAIETFTGTILSATGPGNVIKSVAVGMRIRANGGTPARSRAVLRVGGADYVGPVMTPDSGYGAVVSAFDLNPATSAPWANITAANGEFGVKGVA